MDDKYHFVSHAVLLQYVNEFIHWQTFQVGISSSQSLSSHMYRTIKLENNTNA